VRAQPRARQASVGRLPAQRPQHGELVQGAAFLATVLATACWAAPLTSALGAEAVERVLVVALPVALALQWALRGRYVAGLAGRDELAGARGRLAACALAMVLLPAAAAGAAGAVAGGLVVTWTGGALVLQRGRWAGHLLVVAAATVALAAGLPAAAVVVAAAGAVTGVAWPALGRRRAETAATTRRRGARAPGGAERRERDGAAPRTERGLSGALARDLRAGALGGALGVLLIGDPTVAWSAGAAPALFLAPAALAGLWAGHHLRRLGHAIPAAVCGVPAEHATAAGHEPLLILAGALARMVVATAALSAALAAAAPALGVEAGGHVLLGFGLVALATLLVGLAETLGRGAAALAIVACGALAEIAIAHAAGATPGTGLVVGGALVTAAALPLVVLPLARPATTLATVLWIP
jgi:hypothetical protein